MRSSACRAAFRTRSMCGTQSFDSATGFKRSQTLPPSEIKSLYGSITRSAVISCRNSRFVMPFLLRFLLAFQATQHLREGHLRLSRLKAPFHRGFDPVLRLWIADTFKEQGRIPTEVFRRRERERIDSLLDCGKADSRKAGDPVS